MVKSKFDTLPVKPKEEKITRSFYIEAEVWEEFQKQCKKVDRSASEVLAALVKEFISK